MFKNIFKIFTKIYHKILNIFFDFDVGVYAVKPSAIPIHNITNLKESNHVKCHIPALQHIVNRNESLQLKPQIARFSTSILPLLLIRNFNTELYNSIKIKSENLEYLCIPKNYRINFINDLHITNEIVIFQVTPHKSFENEIAISRKLRTIEELLELEPYTNKLSIKQFLEIPTIKYPIKKNKFSENQLDYMRTKLAATAKCKKYSMTVEYVFDKIPAGMYDEIELTKENTIICKYDKNPDTNGELQILVTGKRKYDTQSSKVLIKYSDLGI